MKNILLTILIFFSFSVVKAQRIDMCNVYGSIYFVDDRRYADVIVTVEEDEYMANVIVFKEDNKLFSDGAGLWTVTDTKEFADYRVFIDKDKRFADFTIYYAEERSSAGCN